VSSLYGKLAAVTAAVKHVAKNGENAFHGYKYVTEGDLVDAIRGHLASLGVAYLFSVESAEVREVLDQGGKPAKGGPVTTVKVSATFADDSGDQHKVYGMGSGQDAGDKGLYKAITGAQKYLLMKTFLVATGDDPESDAAVDKAAADGEPAAKKETAKAHSKKAGAKPADDPMELVIPGGKFKDRKIGSLTLEEAQSVATAVAGTAFGKAAQARVDTLKALETAPAAVKEANGALDLEAAK
jgi:hypothetical protein